MLFKSVMVVLVTVAPDDAICDNLLGCQASGWQSICKSLGAQRFYSQSCGIYLQKVNNSIIYLTRQVLHD